MRSLPPHPTPLTLSEERTQIALDAADLGSFVWYPDEDRAETDERMLALFGLPPAGTLSLAVALENLIHPDHRRAYADAVARSLDAGADRGELREEILVVHPDGTERWLQITARTAFEGDPPRPVRMAGVAADVTERKRAEEALRRSEERQAFLLELTDALRPLTEPHALLSTASRLVGEHLGVDRTIHAGVADAEDGALGVRVREGVAPMTETFAYEAFGAGIVDSLSRGEPGDARLLEEVAERTWAAVERARAEQALRLREEQYRAVFDAIDEGFCFVEVLFGDDGRPADYRFLEVNAVFEEQTGLHDPVGRTALELVPGLEGHWVETYGAVALTGEPRRFSEGSEVMGRYFDVYAARVGGESSRQVAIVFRDITASRAADDALRESEQRFRQLAEIEQRARLHAELLSEVVAELEAVEGIRPRAERLVELLVPSVVSYAAVTLPDDDDPVSRGAGEAELALALPLGKRARGSLELGGGTGQLELASAAGRVLAGEIASRVSLLIGNARVQEEEHRIALRLQQALLPNRLQRHVSARVAVRYEPSSDVLDVGGDWYDSFALAGGRIGIAVGDVVGHGLEAAATMGRLRTALAALAAQADDAGELLGQLDDFASGPNGAEFATACYAILDPASGLLRYSSAGHPPMLVVGPNGATRWLAEARSPPLGGGLAVRHPEECVALEPGSLLVAYSDGLVERRGEPISVGLARLEGAARECVSLHVEDACDRIVAELEGPERTDDVVVLCLRFAPVPSDSFDYAFPARTAELRAVRAAVGAWLDEHDVGPDERAAIVLAVGEACSNAVEHAYHAGPVGRVEVGISEHGERLEVEVRDFGGWRVASGREDDRGRGTMIMEAVTETFARETGPRGTTVRFALAARRTGAA